MDEEEFDRLMEERVNSRFFRFAEDGDEFEDKPMEDNSSLHHALKESIPTIWRVKCTVCHLKCDFVILLTIVSSIAFIIFLGLLYHEAHTQSRTH